MFVGLQVPDNFVKRLIFYLQYNLFSVKVLIPSTGPPRIIKTVHVYIHRRLILPTTLSNKNPA